MEIKAERTSENAMTVRIRESKSSCYCRLLQTKKNNKSDQDNINRIEIIYTKCTVTTNVILRKEVHMHT